MALIFLHYFCFTFWIYSACVKWERLTFYFKEETDKVTTTGLCLKIIRLNPQIAGKKAYQCNALATLKPDHACLIPAWLHQIGNCKKNCRHGSGVMPVVGRKLEGTFLYYQILTCFSPASSLFFSPNKCSFKFPSKFWCKQAGIEQAWARKPDCKTEKK